MHPVFKTFMPMCPAPAYAFAGAETCLPPPSQGFRNPLDLFSMADRSPSFNDRAHDPIYISFFASSRDDTPVVPPRGAESSGSAGGFDSGGASIPPAVTAYAVYTALLSIPICRVVRFDNQQALLNLLGTRAWIREIPDGERKATKAFAARLESTEAELDRVNQELREDGSSLERFKAFIGSLFRRSRTELSTGMFRDLKARRRELDEKAGVERAAKERLDRIALSNIGYIFLTDAGRKVMVELDSAKGDPRMEKLSVDDFLKLIGTE